MPRAMPLPSSPSTLDEFDSYVHDVHMLEAAAARERHPDGDADPARPAVCVSEIRCDMPRAMPLPLSPSSLCELHSCVHSDDCAAKVGFECAESLASTTSSLSDGDDCADDLGSECVESLPSTTSSLTDGDDYADAVGFGCADGVCGRRFCRVAGQATWPACREPDEVVGCGVSSAGKPSGLPAGAAAKVHGERVSPKRHSTFWGGRFASRDRAPRKLRWLRSGLRVLARRYDAQVAKRPHARRGCAVDVTMAAVREYLHVTRRGGGGKVQDTKQLQRPGNGCAPIARRRVRYRASVPARAGETDRQRCERVLAGSGDRLSRLRSDRVCDAKLTAKALELQCASRNMLTADVWPPARDPGMTAPQQLDAYFEHLSQLSDGSSRFLPHVCSNCNEVGCDHAPSPSQPHLCWRCRPQACRLRRCNDNVDLCLNPCAPGVSVEDRRLRKRWAALQAKHGGLSAMEEALVCRVSTCTQVLSLPSGGQLGYRGSVINFVNDLALVSAQLPRAPEDSGLVVYAVRGAAPSGSECQKMLRVRRAAVRDYLHFFAENHAVYRDGIRDTRSDGGEWLVPPFTLADFNESQLMALPDDGIVVGRVVLTEMHSILGNAEQPHLGSDSSGSDDSDNGGTGGDSSGADGAQPRRLSVEEREMRNRRVSEPVLRVWLRSGRGLWAQHVRAALYAPPLSIGNLDGDDAVHEAYRVLHGLPGDVPLHTGGFTVLRLARRLNARFRCGGSRVPIRQCVDILHGELVAAAASIDVPFHVGAVTGPSGDPALSGDPEAAIHSKLRAQLAGQRGTSEEPFAAPARDGTPISEFASKDYLAASFPTLFPFGRGGFSEVREHALQWSEWSRLLVCHRDQRFSTHPRFVYALLNTHERDVALRVSGLFAHRGMTVGDVRRLDKSGKERVAQEVFSHGSTVRNSRGFFMERRKELLAMVEQHGDPNVFATNSHADTQCPYLHRFILTWARILPGSDEDPDVDELLPIGGNERYRRRVANLSKYTHAVALFFHLKTQLFIEYICKGILRADAHWMRYEWQARGSTHVHFFLWLADAPDTSYLNEWVRESAVDLFPDNSLHGTVDEGAVESLVATVNARLTHGLKHAVSCPCACHLGGDVQVSECRLCDCKAAVHAAWWADRCTRLNDAWSDADRRPEVDKDAPHPSTLHHWSHRAGASVCQPCERLPAEAVADLAALRNKVNRHFSHTPYCLRLDKQTGKEYCRFHFPLETREPNRPHIYAERVGGGVRFRLYLPLNDPLMNTVNTYQSLSQRSNTDFKPVSAPLLLALCSCCILL